VVEPADGPARQRIRLRLIGSPLVSVVVPTAFAGRKVVACIHSIRTRSTWAHYEILVLADRDGPADVQEMLEQFGARIIPFRGPFNFAATINHGASQARGSQLLFLNDDTEVITPDWLEGLLEYAQQPDIGAVGAKLLFPHRRLQHIGVHLLEGHPWHAFYGYPGDCPGYFDSHLTPRNYCAVTGACLMTRREVFEELGGLDVRFPLNYNDVDYCLRVLRTGRRIVATPYAQLLHHEAFTKRGADPAERALFQARWGEVMPRDPFYNPNLATGFPDYRIDPGRE
jgi:GT2 family glycosyltransferase